MGESSDTPLRLQFDHRVRLDFRGATITSDAGLLACRELDAALGLTETANDYIHENRTGRNVQHPLLPLLRQSVYSRLAGYEDTNDAERLAQDPAMRVIVGWQGTDKQAASTNTMSRFETEVLTEEENLDGLARLNVEWVARAMAQTSDQRVILDMDSSESPVHGQQEGVAYNGHFESVCYHPLFLFNHFGDCEGAMLRPGNVHSAERWREVLEPVVKRYQEKGVRLLFRADAAFAKPEVYEYLESRDTGYAMRLPANEVLQGNIRHLLKRPVGRPPKGESTDQAGLVLPHAFDQVGRDSDVQGPVSGAGENVDVGGSWRRPAGAQSCVTHRYSGLRAGVQRVRGVGSLAPSLPPLGSRLRGNDEGGERGNDEKGSAEMTVIQGASLHGDDGWGTGMMVMRSPCRHSPNEPRSEPSGGAPSGSSGLRLAAPRPSMRP